jgi:hypothetical protein
VRAPAKLDVRETESPGVEAEVLRSLGERSSAVQEAVLCDRLAAVVAAAKTDEGVEVQAGED